MGGVRVRVLPKKRRGGVEPAVVVSTQLGVLQSNESMRTALVLGEVTLRVESLPTIASQ